MTHPAGWSDASLLAPTEPVREESVQFESLTPSRSEGQIPQLVIQYSNQRHVLSAVGEERPHRKRAEIAETPLIALDRVREAAQGLGARFAGSVGGQ